MYSQAVMSNPRYAITHVVLTLNINYLVILFNFCLLEVSYWLLQSKKRQPSRYAVATKARGANGRVLNTSRLAYVKTFSWGKNSDVSFEHHSVTKNQMKRRNHLVNTGLRNRKSTVETAKCAAEKLVFRGICAEFVDSESLCFDLVPCSCNA